MQRIHRMYLVYLAVTIASASLSPTAVRGETLLKDISLDRPLILEGPGDFVLRNVNVTGLTDCAALTLTGRIETVTINDCAFGKVTTGPEGRAAGLECAGAIVTRLTATNTSFFDAEEELASLKGGSFGTVTFQNCHFSTSERFLQDVQEAQPWHVWLPVTEFYNIDRLELFDNDFRNTVIIIHPSVKQVIIRGNMPGLILENPKATTVTLEPGAA